MQKKRHTEGVRLRKMRDTLQRALAAELPALVINGSEKKRLPGYLHVSMPGLDAERVIFNLDAKGVMIATGAACAANKGTRSSVLEAVGMDEAYADGSLRISLGHQIALEDIDRVIPLIVAAIRTESAL